MRILRSPDEGAVSNVDPPATAGVSETEPATAGGQRTEDPDVQEPEPELDLESLPDGLRVTAKAWLEKRAGTLAEEKANAIAGGKLNWLPKEEREAFEKKPEAFKELKEKAEETEKLRRELEEMRRQPRQEPEANKRERPVEESGEVDDIEGDLADLDKEFEHTEVEKKWVRSIIRKAESRTAKAFGKKLEAMERRFFDVMDSHAASREEIKSVTTDPDYVDPEIGENVQVEVLGEMKLAEMRGKPIGLKEALKRVQARWTPLKEKLKSQNGAGKSPAPEKKSAPPAPEKGRTAPALGDMNGRTTPKGSEPEVDVNDDDQLFAEFHKDPAVRAHFDRRL